MSPILRPQNWRAAVTATWNWIEQNYTISGDRNCGTHVHISRGPYFTLNEVRRVAQATIWWEPAWEAVLPFTRRRNCTCRRSPCTFGDVDKLKRSSQCSQRLRR